MKKFYLLALILLSFNLIANLEKLENFGFDKTRFFYWDSNGGSNLLKRLSIDVESIKRYAENGKKFYARLDNGIDVRVLSDRPCADWQKGDFKGFQTDIRTGKQYAILRSADYYSFENNFDLRSILNMNPSGVELYADFEIDKIKVNFQDGLRFALSDDPEGSCIIL